MVENETDLATLKFLREVKEEAEERIDDDALKINDILFGFVAFLDCFACCCGKRGGRKRNWSDKCKFLPVRR